MKTLLTNVIFIGFATAAMAADTRGLDFEYSESNQNSHVVINSRPLASDLRSQMIQNRQSEVEELKKTEETDQIQLASLTIPIKNQSELVSHPLYTTTANFAPFIYHWIDYFPQANILRTEDGSEWIFDESDNHIMRTWRSGDTVVVSPKTKWLWGSPYAYVMTNKDLGTSVNVNLYLGPLQEGEYTNWVVGLNPSLGQVYLINGQGERTVWEINPSDYNLFKEWAVNDTIIIGENDYWLSWFSPHNHIMINVNMGHNVRAKHSSSIPNMRKGGN